MTTTTDQLNTTPATHSRTRQAVSAAGTKATSTARQNPKSTTAALLALAGAAAAAVVLGRRRTAAKAAPRSKLAALLNR
ncbi:hypothetical protein ACQP2E_14330 [Actinoplanes sp. CA-015351]|uniref:hypothetical protein n=1 Tax=Actinoplanes sp. CA-015351 TaxID=3239897 RepID=UPI003D951D58